MSSMLSAPAAMPGDQARRPSGRRSPRTAARPDMLRDQRRQPGPLGQGHHRDQARPRHKIRVIKRSRASSPGHATIALKRCPLRSDVEASATPIVPVQRAPFASTRPNEPLFSGGLRLSAYRVRRSKRGPGQVGALPHGEAFDRVRSSHSERSSWPGWPRNRRNVSGED